MPSHRYSRPRYRPSAHALDTRTLGPHTLVSDGAAAGATFGFAGAPTATLTRSVAPSVATPSSAVQRDAGFADTLLRRIEADEQAFVLQYVQPGLVGLIDGTLSTLAPIFAVALLSSSHAALLVGLATALGAGISMGLSEALSDDGAQTGRGSSTTRAQDRQRRRRRCAALIASSLALVAEGLDVGDREADERRRARRPRSRRPCRRRLATLSRISAIALAERARLRTWRRS